VWLRCSSLHGSDVAQVDSDVTQWFAQLVVNAKRCNIPEFNPGIGRQGALNAVGGAAYETV